MNAVARVWINSTEVQSCVKLCAAGCFGSTDLCEGLQVVGAAASSTSAEVGGLSARGRTAFWSTPRYDCSQLLSAFLQSFDSPANMGF